MFVTSTLNEEISMRGKKKENEKSRMKYFGCSLVHTYILDIK